LKARCLTNYTINLINALNRTTHTHTHTHTSALSTTCASATLIPPPCAHNTHFEGQLGEEILHCCPDVP